MVTDGQVIELRRLLKQGKSLAASSRMTQMSEKTARDYRDDDRLPSQRKTSRKYRTRVDPFAKVWNQIEKRLQDEPRLKAKTLFGWLQGNYPGEFPDSTRRTFERRVARWRALHGPGKTVFFSQQHQPAALAASDFTVCNSLKVKIAGTRFEHTFFHCVLTYSNVQSVSLCFSESFEALSEGIQKAFWEFGGVPQRHRTDSLSAAIRNHSSGKILTERYAALMEHYRCEPERTNARCANENGDVEAANGHLKDTIDQALLLRGSRDFANREDYVKFVEAIVRTANMNRCERFAEEERCLGGLPNQRLDTDDMLTVTVRKSSTIQVRTNTYSVPSRLIGRKVDVRIGAEQIEVSHQGHHVQTMQRLAGKKGMSVNYRHIIDSLMRKPGAFANYQYREEMFPTSHFRIAYDMLRAAHAGRVADKTYIRILELAARESQDAVNDALRMCVGSGESIDFDRIELLVKSTMSLPAVTDLEIEPPNLSDFDSLLHSFDRDSLHDDENNQPQTETPAEEKSAEEKSAESEPNGAVDGPTAGTSPAEFSGPLRADGDSSVNGEPQPPGLSLGANDAGMRRAARGTNQATDDSLEASAGQNVGFVRDGSSSASGSSPTGNTSRRFVLESPRERASVRQARQWKEPCAMCSIGTVDPAGPQHVVYHLQHAGTAVVNRETGLTTAEVDQAVTPLRRSDHRRPGLRTAESRGDGSVVHTSCGTLRAGKRVVDKQFGVQQMGSDLQGCDDDCRGDRPLSTSQRDHRAERTELPSRNSQEDKVSNPIESDQSHQTEFITGNSNCR